MGNGLGLLRTLQRLVGRTPAPVAAAPMRRRVFAAARADRLTLDWLSSLGSGEQDVRVDIRRLRGRSRTVTRDTPEGKRFCGLFAENVIGPHGIRLTPRVKMRASGEYDRGVNDAILSAWERWNEPENCLLDQSDSWIGVQQSIARMEPMDGEYLVRMVTGAPNDFGFALQVLDVDQLDLEYTVERLAGGGRIVQGIEFDRYGRRVAFHIWDGHPNDANKGERRRIPAEEIIHDFIPWRIGAKRGIPWLHAGLTAVNMLGGYQEAELVATRDSAAVPGWFEKGPDAAADDDDDTPPELPRDVEPGTYYELPTGYKAVRNDSNHPSTAFGEFVRSVSRRIATAGGVSYMSLTGDLSDTSYSSGRIGLLAERDGYRMLQGRKITHLHRRVYRTWLKAALLTGALKLPVADLERYHAVQWRPRGFPWIDPLKDIDAFEREVKLGLNSRTAGCNERGRDFEETLAELDHEQQLAEEYGVTISGSEVPPQHAPDQPVTPAQPANGPAKGRASLRVS